MTVQMLCTFERKYYLEIISQHKIKDAGLIDGIVKFIFYTKIEIPWMMCGGWVVLWEWKMKGSQKDFLNGKFHNTRSYYNTSGKTKKKMGGHRPEGYVTYPRNMRMER